MTIIIFTKFTYYLKLIESLAPHIDIIFEIFNGIAFFIVIFFLNIFACSSAFWLLGRNQIQFDGLKPDEFPPYSTMSGSLWNTWFVSLGNPSA